MYLLTWSLWDEPQGNNRESTVQYTDVISHPTDLLITCEWLVVNKQEVCHQESQWYITCCSLFITEALEVIILLLIQMWMWLYHRAEEGFYPLAVMWPKGGAWHLEQNVLHPLRVSFSDAQRPGGKVFILLPVQRSVLRTYKAFLFSGFTNNVTTKQSHETGYQCHRLNQDFLTYLRVHSHERGGVCSMWDEAHSLPTIRAPGHLNHHLWRMFCVRWTCPSVCSSAACFFQLPSASDLLSTTGLRLQCLHQSVWG